MLSICVWIIICKCLLLEFPLPSSSSHSLRAEVEFCPADLAASQGAWLPDRLSGLVDSAISFTTQTSVNSPSYHRCFGPAILDSMLQFTKEKTPVEIAARCQQNQWWDQGWTKTVGLHGREYIMNIHFFPYLLKIHLVVEGFPFNKSFILKQTHLLNHSHWPMQDWQSTKTTRPSFLFSLQL